VPQLSKADKLRALKNAVNTVAKQGYAKGITIIGEDPSDDAVVHYDVISTGSALIDGAIGIGGLPRGRIVEIYGEESCGKTTLITTTIAEAQKKYPDDYVAIVDVEHAFDRAYAQKLGLNLETLVYNQPDSGEEALDYVKTLVGSGACSVVVLDSVAGLMTQQQLAKGVDEATMGQVAKLMSEQLRELVKLAQRTNTLVIFINQTRDKLGVMFGNPTTTTGGKALKFYASIRIEVKRGKALIKGELPIGQELKVNIVKNKVSNPFMKAETELYFGIGFNKPFEVAELACSRDIIGRSGAYYDIPDENGEANRVQGKEAVAEYLAENPSALEFIQDLTLKPEPESGDIVEHA
jgi:recombination protein RecA